MMINDLKNIIGKRVKQLFLVVWPPFGESNASQIDISFGYVFTDISNEIFVISTDKDDLTTPVVEYVPIPEKYFRAIDFDRRMQKWMNCDEEMELDYEYYEVTDDDIFQNIVDQRICDIELVKIFGTSPIGVKLIFKKDFVLSTPISDGNTIETSLFNINGNLNNFTSLGRIEYISLGNMN